MRGEKKKKEKEVKEKKRPKEASLSILSSGLISSGNKI